MDQPRVYIFTDGGCRNSGYRKGRHHSPHDPSAWAYMIRFSQFPTKFVSNSQAYRGKTNNQMELSAVIFALNALLINMPPSSIKRVPFVIICDSKYVINGTTKWSYKWKKHDYRGIKNQKYWRLLLHLYSLFSHISFKWVHGHRENKHDFYHQGNCFVDHKLNKAMDHLSPIHNQK